MELVHQEPSSLYWHFDSVRALGLPDLLTWVLFQNCHQIAAASLSVWVDGLLLVRADHRGCGAGRG